MDKVIIVIWCINLVLAIAFAVSNVHKGQKIWLAIFFAVLPLAGFAIYFLPRGILGIRQKYAYDRDSLVKRYDIEDEQAEPSVEKALNVIPIEDAMAVGSNKEKRALLLEQLKKNMKENYKVVLPAGSDSDSESAHYVAAAKMEVYRKKYSDLSEIQKQLEKNPKDVKLAAKYLKELKQYIESELLAEREAEIYKEEYCRKFEALGKQSENEISDEMCGCYIEYLIDLKQPEKAEEFWKNCSPKNKNEAGYKKMLEMYYGKGLKDKFYACLHELEESEILLSPEGLKMLRYWIARRK